MSAVDELLQPISPDSRGGRDVSDDVEAFQIAQARSAATGGLRVGQERPSQQRAARHDAAANVVTLATKILKEDSKDLTVAAWLTEAWLIVDDFGGLANGLELLQRLLKEFWEDLYPEDPEGRVVALEFVGKELTTPVKLVEITDWHHTFYHHERAHGGGRDQFGEVPQEDADVADSSIPTGANFDDGFRDSPKPRYKQLDRDLARCSENLQALTTTFEDRFDSKEFRPAFSPLKQALERAHAVVSELLAKKLEEDPDPVESEPVEVVSSGKTGEANAVSEPSGGRAMSPYPTTTADAVQRVIDGARFLRKQNPMDPAPYLTLRGLRWGELRSGDSIDLRLLDAPPTDVRKRLKGLLLDGDWTSLLESCEEVMATPSGRGWLDLQRYAVTALENLGGGYRMVAEAIVSHLRLLLEDFPDLPSSMLMDDAPTANGETLEWLARLGVGDDETTPREQNWQSEGDPERVRGEASYEKAREWAVSGNPQRGVSSLMRRAQHETSERARFITLGHAAAIMVDHGMASVARPILEDLVQETSERKLKDWEAGEVVARPLALLYRCLPDGDGTRDQLYQQICRLDPVQAWRLDGSSGAVPADAEEAPTPTNPEEETGERPEGPDDGSAVDS